MPRGEVQGTRIRGQLPNQLTSVAHTFCAPGPVAGLKHCCCRLLYHGDTNEQCTRTRAMCTTITCGSV